MVASTDPVNEEKEIIDADYSEAPQETEKAEEVKSGETEGTEV